jgi:chromosome segregation ATPase
MNKPKAPFAKPPTSQHCAPPFYWRGGDTYHEKEYITDEHRKASNDLRKAEEEYERLRGEVQAASKRLRECDGYTAALAAFLDGDAEGLLEEHPMKEELREIEKQIILCERNLNGKRSIHNSGVAGALRKERAYYLIEIERITKALENTNEEIANYKTQLAALAISKRSNTAVTLEWQQIKWSTNANI